LPHHEAPNHCNELSRLHQARIARLLAAISAIIASVADWAARGSYVPDVKIVLYAGRGGYAPVFPKNGGAECSVM
jgi:hypothetical protein